MNERVQKVLAAGGYGSRREIERLIRAGRVTIGDRPARLGDRYRPGEVIAIDGRPVVLGRVRHQHLLYHKREGELCSRLGQPGRPTVFAQLPALNGSRWVSVGRLDLNTSGLLLFTTEGELAHQLMHPSTGLLRTYLVRIRGHLEGDARARLETGVQLEDGFARFDFVRPRKSAGSHQWVEVGIREGRKREVRRLWEAAGYAVSRLRRIGYGPIRLERGLRPGQWRYLSAREARELYRAVQEPRTGLRQAQ